MIHGITRFAIFTLIIAMGLLDVLGCAPSRQSSKACARCDSPRRRTNPA